MNQEDTLRRIDIISIRQVKDKTIDYGDIRLTSPQEVFKLAKFFMEEADREMMIVIALDTRKKPNSISVVSIGTISASLVHPREVFKSAILSNAASIILVHNHPSGECSPSQEDTLLTERIKSAGELMGIELVDHLVLGDASFFSYKAEGRL